MKRNSKKTSRILLWILVIALIAVALPTIIMAVETVIRAI